MIIYHDTEKELFLEDYKAVDIAILRTLSLDSLKELKENLESTSENAFFNHNDMLSMAIDTDIQRTDLYIRMRQKQHEKKAKTV